ncbi:hypothetical protein HII31_08123 [Pseudocercospora fuligena]|uniref:Uncharacterized protein n=1 Tax=Pseudocercospora fuligena TaxID=685502 RepID=A0A8H6VK46_9PEZI|nr:hypothetical protein HII31_08123 [Pseudocercospora fuligena]
MSYIVEKSPPPDIGKHHLNKMLTYLQVLFAIGVAHVSATALQTRDYSRTDFWSAIHVNVCSELNKGGLSYKTESCECTSPNTIRASCISGSGQIHQHVRHCSTRNRIQVCLTSENSPQTKPDCACKPKQRKKGSKAPNDKDGIACSGGIHFLAALARGVEAVNVWSTITGTPADKIGSCWVQDNKGHTLTTYAPCVFDQGGVPLRLPLHSDGVHGVPTFQACIEAPDNDPAKVDFQWVVTSPFGHPTNHKRNDDGSSGEIENLVGYDGSMATRGWQGGVVVRHENGEEVATFVSAPES